MTQRAVAQHSCFSDFLRDIVAPALGPTRTNVRKSHRNLHILTMRIGPRRERHPQPLWRGAVGLQAPSATPERAMRAPLPLRSAERGGHDSLPQQDDLRPQVQLAKPQVQLPEQWQFAKHEQLARSGFRPVRSAKRHR